MLVNSGRDVVLRMLATAPAVSGQVTYKRWISPSDQLQDRLVGGHSLVMGGHCHVMGGHCHVMGGHCHVMGGHCMSCDGWAMS